jgi:hypothetical protein
MQRRPNQNGVRKLIRRTTWVISCLLTLAGIARADTITVQLAQSGGEYVATFDSFNGTPLNGQTQSIDMMFANGQSFHIFNDEGNSSVLSFFGGLSVALQITGGGVCPGDFLTGSSYLLGQNGMPLVAPGPIESACGNSSSVYPAGFVGVTPSPLTALYAEVGGAPAAPYTFYGVHFDLTYPNVPGATVSDGQMSVDLEAGVPEPSSFLLLAVGLGFLVLARHYKPSSTLPMV